jgi:hypothetical protein
MEKIEKHLWEIGHPYYCEETNYYMSPDTKDSWGSPLKYNSFKEYLEDFGGNIDIDLDRNFIFRWDWEKEGKKSTLKIFLMLQRKGTYRVITINNMRNKDEDEVKKHLKKSWERMKLTWEGISY